RIVRLIWPACSTEMIELLEIGRRHTRIRICQGLETLRAIAPRRSGNRVNRLALLLQGQSKEGVRLCAQLLPYGDRHAVAGQSEKSDLTAVSVNRPGDILPCGKAASARFGKIDDRDRPHVRSLADG